MKTIKEGVIFADDDPQSSTRVACFPSLARLSDGRILCTFRVGSTKESADETVRIAESADEGRTWQLTSFQPATDLNGVPGSLRFGHLIETKSNYLLLATTWVNREDPTLPVAHPETGGCLELELVIFRSTNGGQ
ncbi:MAG TPA: sialidase family protein, partial [Abditibacteriaceae bacterium]|nr:sialidase family protein [Abditibacteriaceae bacterium]